MLRLPLFLALVLPFAVEAQTPSDPHINLNGSGSTGGSGGTSDQGTASVSGSIVIPADWKLSIHTITIRFSQSTGGSTLNAFIPVKGMNFTSSLGLKHGSYKIWAVIDVKDAAGRERQISSEPVTVQVQ